ncbi:MAG: HEAT repeat domain-containing protein [Gemmataceae bacterium]
MLAAPSAKTNDAQRSWAGTVFALLALMLALAAMPASVIHHPLLGAGLATLGLTLALFAVLTCLFRRGIGLALIALLVGGTALFSVVALAGGAANLLQPVKDRLAVPRPQDVKQEVEELAVTQKQPENEGTQPKKESDERRNDGKGQVKETASQHSQRDEEQPAQREPAQKPSRKEQKDAKVLPNQADGNTNPLGITFSPPKLVPPPLPRPAAHDKPAPKPPPPASLEQPRTATQKVDERLQVDAEKRAAAEREKQRWLAVEQRMRAGEEELRKQLVAVPELRLVNDLDVQALHKNAQALRKNAKSQSVIVDLHQYLVKAGIQAGLPVRAGAQAYLQQSAALVVEQLSKSLRDLGFVSGVPSAGARRRARSSPENRPLDKVAEFQKWCDDKQIGKANAALPTLLQMLQVEKPPLRRLLVRELAKINNRDTTIVLTYRALLDLDPEVRDLAVKALEKRSSNHYLPVLLKALRYPWPPVADHAALALRKLKTTGIESQLLKLLELPDPSVPVLGKKTKKLLVPELVRLNHMRNCLLCHAPSSGPKDGLVRGRVPTPGQPLPPAYYQARSGDFVRADTTFLRQDFSVILTVEGAAPWPAEQRFDFMVRTRVVTPDEMSKITAKPDNNYPQREAALYVLRGITGKDAGESAEKWREMLGIAREKEAGSRKTEMDKAPPK